MPEQIAAYARLSKDAIDMAYTDIRVIAAEDLRQQIMAVAEGRSVVPGSWHLESQPFREVRIVEPRGVWGRLLRWLGREPEEHVYEGEDMRAWVWVEDA